MSEYSIGLDLGGTNLRAGAVDRAGNLLEKTSLSSGCSEGREALVDDIVSSIRKLRVDRKGDRLVGVGVVVPGFIRLKEGVIANSNNLTCLENFPIREEIEQRLDAPVVLENDANAAALGEKWIGAGREVDDLVLLTLGTGIGGGIISGGKILHGYLGMAGELGHLTVVTNGNPCGCGNRGCVEKHASATAIVAQAKLLGLGEGLTSEDVYNLALGGDIKALAIFESVGQALGIALAMLINTFNFPLFLLSGGVLAAWDLFAPPMLEEIRKRSFTFRTTNTRVAQAALGSEAGLYGAAYLAWNQGKS